MKAWQEGESSASMTHSNFSTSIREDNVDTNCSEAQEKAGEGNVRKERRSSRRRKGRKKRQRV